MGFAEAVKSALSKYATFSGRARRSEFWYFYLFYFLAYMVAVIIAAVVEVPAVAALPLLAFVVPYISVAIRRLHDTGRSGWSYLIGFIPLIGTIWLIVVACRDSEGDNEYGPSPKYPTTVATSGYHP